MKLTTSDQATDKSPQDLDSLTNAQIRELARLYPEIASGVRGDVVIRAAQKTMFINIIVSNKPGQGLVSKYLDNLPSDFTVIVPSVLSRRFAGMLERRGFVSESIEGSWTRKPRTLNS